MRDYQLAKQDMQHRLQIAENNRLLKGNGKSITNLWVQRLRVFVSSDNMAKDASVMMSNLEPRHNI